MPLQKNSRLVVRLSGSSTLTLFRWAAIVKHVCPIVRRITLRDANKQTQWMVSYPSGRMCHWLVARSQLLFASHFVSCQWNPLPKIAIPGIWTYFVRAHMRQYIYLKQMSSLAQRNCTNIDWTVAFIFSKFHFLPSNIFESGLLWIELTPIVIVPCYLRWR